MGAIQSQKPRKTRTMAIENPHNHIFKIIDENNEEMLLIIRNNEMSPDNLKDTKTNDSAANLLSDRNSVASSFNDPMLLHPALSGVEPKFTSLEVQRLNEENLRKNDVYWKERLAEQEELFQNTNTILEKEFEAAIENVSSYFPNNLVQTEKDPCCKYREQIIDCLQTHFTESLRCSKIVNEFCKCVGFQQRQMLDRRHTNVQETSTKQQ